MAKGTVLLEWVFFFGFLVAFIGCTGSPSCLSECVFGLFMSVFSVLLVSSSLVFGFLLLGCLLSECALVLSTALCSARVF